MLNRQFYTLITAFGVPLVFNAAAWPLVSDPMSFVHRTVPYILETRDYFNSSILGNGIYYGLPMWLILALRIGFTLLAAGSLYLLYKYYRERDPLFWLLTSSGVLLHRVVPGALAGPGLLLDDAVPVPDDGGAAQLRAAQLAGLAGGVRVHDDGPLAARPLADHRTLPGVHEDHLRLVAAVGGGVLRAVLPLSGRQGRGQAGFRYRSALDDG